MGVHRWLVDHGWVKDYHNKFGLFLTYMSFITIPGVLVFALVEFMVLLVCGDANE